jgi:hypothetical protein
MALLGRNMLQLIKKTDNTLISGFRRDVYEICGLLGYYATSCGNCWPTFIYYFLIHVSQREV